uniref:Uncharacterized protein n=1 Tax=Ovis aries TaxID=9940 RepID=A0AC11DS96_SHEEP
MGLLSQGSPLSWEETKRHADHVRRHGILQFLHIYHAVKDRHKDVLKWGDEQTRSRRWEGVSVPECDTGCLEEFSGWGVCRRRLLTHCPRPVSKCH